ncbi:MAG: hypothetical protein NC339_08535 [Muribaculaceae bacterium]|nr:hypothetical protein [Muribaculaceae bacterium]
MSPKDKQNLRSRLNKSLLHAHEKMLRDKALHDDTVIYCNRQGDPIIVPAQQALDNFRLRFPA